MRGDLIRDGKVAPIVWKDLLGTKWTAWGREKATGLDCFGLVLVVQRRLGRTVADVLDYDPVVPGRAIVDRAHQWRAVDGPGAGRVVSIRMLGGEHADHVGIMLDDRTVLHTVQGEAGVSTVPLARLADRVVGYYEPFGPTVHVVIVTDPIAKTKLDDWIPWFDGMRVEDCVPAGMYVDVEEMWTRALVWVGAEQGRRDTPVLPHSLVTVVISPGIAVPAALVAATGISASTLALIGNIAIATGLSLVSSLIAAPRPAKLDKSTDEGRPGFSLDGIRNTVANGTTVPVIYGRVRFGGQILQVFTEQDNQFRTTLYMLVSLGEGEVQSVGGITVDSDRLPASAIVDNLIEINGNKISAFPATRVSIRLGKTRQSPIPGFERTVQEFGQNVTLRATSPLVPGQAPIANNDQTYSYTTTQAVDGFALAIRYQAGLYKVDAQTGLEIDYSVFYTLRYRRKGQPATEVVEVIVHGPSNLKADHTRAIKKLGLTRDVYEIWITRMSDNDENLQRRFSISTLTAVREYVSDYPVAYNSRVLYALEIPATAQLSGSIPTVSAIVEGKKVYVWDGVSTTAPNFTFQYSRSPAWVFFDMLLNRRYGGGVHATLNDVDLQNLADFATYCATNLVTNTVTHERWTINGVFDTQQRLWDAIAQVCSAARATCIPSGSRYKIVIDQYTTPSAAFGSGNIISGSVRRRFLPTWRRPNMIRAQFANRNLDWDSDVAQLTAPSVPSGSDFIIEDAQFFGLDMPEQVYRAVKHLLNFSQYVTEGVAFSAPVDAVTSEPGDAIWFESETVRPGGYGGRLIADSPDTTHVLLDRDVTIAAGWSICITVNDPGTQVETVVTVAVASAPGTYAANTSIQVAALPFAPKKQNSYMIGPTGTFRGEYRIVSITRRDQQTFDIETLIQNASVYADDPGVIESFTDKWPDTRRIPGAPTGLRVVERNGVLRDGTVVPGLDVSFVPEQEGLTHDIWVRPMYSSATEVLDITPNPDDVFGERSWIYCGSSTDGLFSITRGLSHKQAYEVSVTPRGPAGTRADPASGAMAAVQPIGKTDMPVAPTTVETFAREGGLLVRWTPSADRDVDHYEIRQASQDGRKFFLAMVLARCACGDRATVVPHAWGSGYYVQVTAVSRSGQRSMLPAYATMPTAPDASRQIRTNTAESVAWPGTKTSMAVTGSVVRGNLGSTTGSYQTGNTTHAISQALSTLHIFVDATVVEVDTTIDQAGYMLTSPHAQRLTVDGILLDAPDPDQYIPLDDNRYPLDSPGSLTNLIDGSLDWDATVRIKIEYDLAQDTGATVWDGWKEYTGPVPMSGRYYCRVKVTWFTATGGYYRVQLEQLRVQSVSQNAPSMTWGQSNYAGRMPSGNASLIPTDATVSDDGGPGSNKANAGADMLATKDTYVQFQCMVPQDLDTTQASDLVIVGRLANPLAASVGNDVVLDVAMSSSFDSAAVGSGGLGTSASITVSDGPDDGSLVYFEATGFVPASTVNPGDTILGSIRRDASGAGMDSSDLDLKILFAEFRGRRLPSSP